MINLEEVGESRRLKSPLKDYFIINTNRSKGRPIERVECYFRTVSLSHLEQGSIQIRKEDKIGYREKERN